MRPTLLLLVSAFATGLVPAQMPESPSLWREVLGVNGQRVVAPTFTRPHMPGLRVTADGRVGVMVESGTPTTAGVAFALMIPEKMTQPFLRSPPGAHTMSSEGWTHLDNNPTFEYAKSQFTPGADNLVHACLWDDSPPVAISGNDFYDLKVLVTSVTDVDKPNADFRTQLHVTPVSVIVANPKTAAARIVSVTRTGPTASSPLLPYYSLAFEPVICGDGRLLIVRLAAARGVHWTDPNTQAQRVNTADIVYSYYSGGATADPARWTNMIPVSFAPYDARINRKFGFAMAPFRDPEGNQIPPGKDIGGSYPWMDRAAKNLFLETIGDRAKFFYDNTKPIPSRYPCFQIPGDVSFAPQEDSGGMHQGVSFLGVWSNGKLVMLDNLNNDIDYAMGQSDGPQTREIELFDDSRDPNPSRSRLVMGYGRATWLMPEGENDNGNIIDSVEARFTYRRHFRSMSLQDVTWPLTNGKQTDEVSFDDHLDPDAFIIASMAGALTYVDSAYDDFRRFEYHDGWQHPSGPFNKPIRLQNAANGRFWNVPPSGQSHGSSRLEPAATGGIHGKGFWLTGDNGVAFAVPVQNPPQKVHDAEWFTGVFVDCRHEDDTTERSVVTFPDGTSLRLYGRRQVIYADSTGAVVHRITVPAELVPYRGWAHLGLQIRSGGHRIDFHLDGILYDRWRDPARCLFQLPAGTLTLGKVQSSSTAGVKGWVDELKVIAHTFDMETMCNHAGGTLIGLDQAYVGEWKAFADRFPAWVHAEISAELRNRGETAYPRYACLHRYDRDHGVHLDDLPLLTYSLRHSMQFPEGPLYHNAPRPQSLQNTFCTSCHYQGGNLGLGLSALTLDPSRTAAEDPRRQPMQPAAIIHGFIPAGLADTVTPPQPKLSRSDPAGWEIDRWTMPTFVGPSVVQSITVADPDTGADLFELLDGMVLDPKALGLTSVRIRANLGSAQGSVTHQWNRNPPQTTAAPPHTQLVGLTAGSHEIAATPAAGNTVSRAFTVPAQGLRVIANYRNAFREGSPDPNWIYAWNDAGDVLSATPYRRLFWSPSANAYNARGLSQPDTESSLAYGALAGSWGHPGRAPGQQSGNQARFVLAGYEVRASGTFRVQDGFVQVSNPALSDGLRVVILVRGPSGVQVHLDQTCAAGAPFSIPTRRLTNLSPGQVIYVGIGPNGNDANDTFTLDFDIAVE